MIIQIKNYYKVQKREKAIMIVIVKPEMINNKFYKKNKIVFHWNFYFLLENENDSFAAIENRIKKLE